MKKYIIGNVVLNLAIVLMFYTGFEAYRVGNALIVGLAIAFSIVLIYLKVVLSKRIKAVIAQKEQQRKQAYQATKKGKF